MSLRAIMYTEFDDVAYAPTCMKL